MKLHAVQCRDCAASVLSATEPARCAACARTAHQREQVLRRWEVPEKTRLSAPEVAHALGVSVAACYDLLNRGILPGRQFGRKWVIHRTELADYLLNDSIPTQETV